MKTGSNSPLLDEHRVYTILSEASSHGHVKIIELFLNSLSKEHAVKKAVKQSFRIAAEANHLNIVQFICENENYSRYLSSPNIYVGVELASEKNKVEVLQYLCEHYLDHYPLETTKTKLCNIFTLSSEANHYKIVQYLYKNQRDKLKKDILFTALSNAAEQDLLQTVRCLCETPPQEFSAKEMQDITVLASREGNLRIVQYFLEEQKNIIAPALELDKIFGLAVLRKRYSVVQYLCENHPPTDKTLNNLFLHCVFSSDMDLVQYFCEKHIHKITNYTLNAALRRSVPSTNIFRILVQYFFEKHNEKLETFTLNKLLIDAISRKDFELIKYLCESPHPQKPSTHGIREGLRLAAEQGNHTYVSYLCENHADKLDAWSIDAALFVTKEDSIANYLRLLLPYQQPLAAPINELEKHQEIFSNFPSSYTRQLVEDDSTYRFCINYNFDTPYSLESRDLLIFLSHVFKDEPGFKWHGNNKNFGYGDDAFFLSESNTQWLDRENIKQASISVSIGRHGDFLHAMIFFNAIPQDDPKNSANTYKSMPKTTISLPPLDKKDPVYSLINPINNGLLEQYNKNTIKQWIKKSNAFKSKEILTSLNTAIDRCDMTSIGFRALSKEIKKQLKNFSPFDNPNALQPLISTLRRVAEAAETGHPYTEAMQDNIEQRLQRLLENDNFSSTFDKAISRAMQDYFRVSNKNGYGSYKRMGDIALDGVKMFGTFGLYGLVKNIRNSYRMKSIGEKATAEEKILTLLDDNTTGQKNLLSFKYFLVSHLTKITAKTNEEAALLIDIFRDKLNTKQQHKLGLTNL